MAIPDFQTLMLPVLRTADTGEVRVSDVVDRLADEFSLSQEERAQLLPSGRQTTFANRVHWAKSYLGKARLIEMTRRAHFRITDRGREVLVSPPERITIGFLNAFPEFREFREAEGETRESERDTTSVVAETSLTPDETIRRAQEQLEGALSDELLERILAGSATFFESLVVRLVVAMGYGGSIAATSRALAIGGPGDGGVDGVIDEDILGLDRIYIQAKRYSIDHSVPPSAIREFFGSLDRFRASKGIFFTTSTFSKSAKDTAEALSKRIVLIDGAQLTRLMIQFGVGCRIEETIHIKKMDEEFFDPS